MSSIHPVTVSDQLTTKGPPAESENTNADRQSSVMSPSRTTRVPSPAGITEPVNENASTTVPDADVVNPLAAASPPAAPVTHPS